MRNDELFTFRAHFQPSKRPACAKRKQPPFIHRSSFHATALFPKKTCHAPISITQSHQGTSQGPPRRAGRQTNRRRCWKTNTSSSLNAPTKPNRCDCCAALVEKA